MLHENQPISIAAPTLGGMAQRTISATKRYRGYVQHVHYQTMAEQEMALWMPTLARLNQDSGWILWVAPPFTLSTELLNAAGISSQRLLTIAPNHADQVFSIVQTALQCRHYSAVFWWAPPLHSAQHQLLEQAAQTGESVGIIMCDATTNQAAGHAH